MPPDLNSLPPSSPSPSTTPLQPRPSPAAADQQHQQQQQQQQQSRTMSQSPSHTPPHSLAAAATMNAGIHNEDLRRQSSSSGSMRREVERQRRRSSIRINLNLNDPAVPAPGEMQRSPSARTRAAPPWPHSPHSPHHERAPSLGELHQELEYEQEGQVNRLLTMIRHQQAQIQNLQLHAHPNNNPTASASAVDDSTPTSERSMSIPVRSRSPLPSAPRLPPSRHSSFADRDTDRPTSHAGSPARRPSFGTAPLDAEYALASGAGLGGRDESAYYQAETLNLTRENQMLKQRIRELERQLAETQPAASSSSSSAVLHSPATASNLHSSPPISRRQTEASDTLAE